MKSIILIFILLFVSAFGGKSYEPVAMDSRIKTFVFNPNEIYNLKFRIGYNSIIEFSKDESIETISLGDPYPWKLTPLGTRLFIKPIEPGVRTNMTVITNKRVYLFEIDSDISTNIDSPNIVHVARFFYPTFAYDEVANNRSNSQSSLGLKQILQEKRTTGSESEINIEYSFAGSENLATPIEAFDDSHRTYFKFSKDVKYNNLKIFIINNNSQKSLVKFKKTGDFLIIEGVYANLLVQYGAERSLIYNEQFS